MALVHNEEDPALRDALSLPPKPPDATANIATMGTAGDDVGAPISSARSIGGPGLWNPPLLFKLATKQRTGVARRQEEGLGLSPIRDTARARMGFGPARLHL